MDKLVSYSCEEFERDVGESRNGDFEVLCDGINEKKLLIGTR